MSGLKEIGIAIARIILGMVVLIEGLTVLVFISYTSTIGGIYSDKVAAAYEDSYDNGHAQTYDVGYQEAYGEAYDKGYSKGYEIGLETDSKEGIARIIELSTPTHKEMWEFLAHDDTDANPHVVGEYECVDFSAQLINNAKANGIRAAYVHIRAKEWAHALVAFETVDRGLIFIEPQTDDVKKVAVGASYWGRTIVEFHIIW